MNNRRRREATFQTRNRHIRNQRRRWERVRDVENLSELSKFKKLSDRIAASFSFLGLNSIDDVNKRIFNTPKEICILFDTHNGVILDALYYGDLPEFNWVNSSFPINLTGAEAYSIFRNDGVKCSNIIEALKGWGGELIKNKERDKLLIRLKVTDEEIKKQLTTPNTKFTESTLLHLKNKRILLQNSLYAYQLSYKCTVSSIDNLIQIIYNSYLLMK